MTKQEICARITEIGIIPAVRLHSESEALFAAEAMCGSGIPVVEVTMTVPGAVRIIGELARHGGGMIVGAGTVFDVDTAARCLDAGAGFLTSPGLDLEIVDFALKRDVAILPGALTPSEVMAAWKAGADFVKVFPCAEVGGPDYIRALKAPFPHIPLIASGRGESEERGRLHSRGRGRARHRPAPDPPECNQAPSTGVDPRVGPAIHKHGKRGAQTDGSVIWRRVVDSAGPCRSLRCLEIRAGRSIE